MAGNEFGNDVKIGLALKIQMSLKKVYKQKLAKAQKVQNAVKKALKISFSHMTSFTY